MGCLVFSSGIVLYAFYSRCAIYDQPIPTSDKISLYFVLKELSSWPGVQGLCLAGLLSGALSTMSSYLNSLAAVTLEDFIKYKYKTLNDRTELVVSKALTTAFGFVSTAFIFATSKSQAVAIVQITAFAVSTGPQLGLFFLGLWSKKANTLGVSLGLLISVAVVAWLSIGSALHGNRHRPLPSPQCPSNSSSLVNIVEQNILDRLRATDDEPDSRILDHIYGISFNWYSLISFAVCVIFGYLFSICISCLRKDNGYSQDTLTYEDNKKSVKMDDYSDTLLEKVPRQRDPDDKNNASLRL